MLAKTTDGTRRILAERVDEHAHAAQHKRGRLLPVRPGAEHRRKARAEPALRRRVAGSVEALVRV